MAGSATGFVAWQIAFQMACRLTALAATKLASKLESSAYVLLSLLPRRFMAVGSQVPTTTARCLTLNIERRYERLLLTIAGYQSKNP